jgi:hypothetical protein
LLKKRGKTLGFASLFCLMMADKKPLGYEQNMRSVVDCFAGYGFSE